MCKHYLYIKLFIFSELINLFNRIIIHGSVKSFYFDIKYFCNSFKFSNFLIFIKKILILSLNIYAIQIVIFYIQLR